MYILPVYGTSTDESPLPVSVNIITLTLTPKKLLDSLLRNRTETLATQANPDIVLLCNWARVQIVMIARSIGQ